MKKFLKFILILYLIATPSFAFALSDDISEELLETPQENEVTLNTNKEEDVSTDEAINNTDFEFELNKSFDKKITKKEDTLLGKIIHSDITRTDIDSFLLQDDLTFKFDKGPVSKTQVFGAYRGAINMFWQHPYSTDYDNLSTQIGAITTFKNPKNRFKLSFNTIPLTNKNYLDTFIDNAYFMNSSIPHHQIQVGYSRVNSGFDGGRSGKILPFVNRSQIARNFGNTKSLSVKVLGNYQYMDYILGYGSSGHSFISGMPGTEFSGWVNFKPLGDKLSKKYGKVSLGGGLNSGHNNINYNVGNIYIGYNHKKLWTNFEAAIADGYNGSKGISSNKAAGYAATIGWKFTPHWQLIGRIDQYDPNRSKKHDLQREYTIGLNWFIKGQALKIVLNYVFCDNQGKRDSHKLILATQILI